MNGGSLSSRVVPDKPGNRDSNRGTDRRIIARKFSLFRDLDLIEFALAHDVPASRPGPAQKAS